MTVSADMKGELVCGDRISDTAAAGKQWRHKQDENDRARTHLTRMR